MPRYIDADALLKHLCNGNPSAMEDYYYNAIKNAPKADVVEVKHGKWKDQYQGMYANQLYKCSVCGETAFHDDERWFLTIFCPNCGAKMDVERKDNG